MLKGDELQVASDGVFDLIERQHNIAFCATIRVPLGEGTTPQRVTTDAA
jgi:hypothetical protein